MPPVAGLRRAGRRLLPLALVSLTACSPVGTGEAAQVPAAQEAGLPTTQQFVDSVGVNVHLYYDDTGYRDTAAVKARLLELGVRHVRDGLVVGRPAFYRALEDLAASGVRSQLVMGSPADAPGHLDQLLQVAREQVTSSVEAFEGANEYDRTGEGWQERLAPHQRELYERVKADPVLGDRPVVGPSVGGLDLEAVLDEGNVHPYPGAEPPEDNLPTELARARRTSGDKPVQITETGYHNALASDDGHRPVPEDVAATYLTRLYLESFRLGISRTYAYELLDIKPDPGRTDPQLNFGLLRADLSPKPAFTALSNLLDALQLESSRVGEPVAHTLEERGPDLRELVLAHPDGHRSVVLWRAVSVYDVDHQAPETVPAETVRLRLSTESDVRVFRPVSGRAPVAASSGTDEVEVEVTGDPVVIDLTAAAGARG